MQAGQAFDLNTFLAPYGLTGQDFYVFITALGAFFTVIIVGRALIARNTFASRIKLLQERRNALREEIAGPRRRKHKRQETIAFMRRVVMKLQLLQKSQARELVNYLVSAGFRSKDALVIFLFFKLITPLVLFLLSLLFVSVDLSGGGEMTWHLMGPVTAAYIGLKLPGFIVNRRRKRRYLSIQKALADTLDLLMICAEAGLSLAQGLERVARELQHAYPEMADELSLTSIEMSFQPDRQKTLTNLAQRVQLQEIRGIVNVLVQTEKYGTPIAQALRTLSAEFRTQRMLRAEQKAARLPAIMTVPMIIFILPTLFIVVMAPAIINLMGISVGGGGE